MLDHRLITIALVVAAGFSLVAATSRSHAQAGPSPASRTISDNFADPNRGILAPSTSNSAFKIGYVDGEYQIAKVDAGAGTAPDILLPGVWVDVSITADARVVGDPTNVIVALRCRRTGSPVSFYQLTVNPGAGTFGLLRFDSGTFSPLQATGPSDAVLQGGQSNHLELDCLGSTISASINGTQVASVQDTTYAQGPASIYAGPANPNTQHIATEARLDSLQISGAMPLAGTVLASDKMSNADTGLLPKSSATPDQWKIGYAGGEYQIASAKPVSEATFSAAASGSYVDVTVGADVRLAAGADATTYAGVGCRHRPAATGFTGYYVFLGSSDNTYHLYRRDPSGPYDFSGLGQHLGTTPDLTGTHHLQITCSGNTITGSVDGQQIGSVQDGTYQAGAAFFRAGNEVFGSLSTGAAIGSYLGSVDVRFSNLRLTQP